MTEPIYYRIAVLTVLFGGFLVYLAMEFAAPSLYAFGLLVAIVGFAVGFTGITREILSPS